MRFLSRPETETPSVGDSETLSDELYLGDGLSQIYTDCETRHDIVKLETPQPQTHWLQTLYP